MFSKFEKIFSKCSRATSASLKHAPARFRFTTSLMLVATFIHGITAMKESRTRTRKNNPGTWRKWQDIAIVLCSNILRHWKSYKEQPNPENLKRANELLKSKIDIMKRNILQSAELRGGYIQPKKLTKWIDDYVKYYKTDFLKNGLEPGSTFDGEEFFTKWKADVASELHDAQQVAIMKFTKSSGKQYKKLIENLNKNRWVWDDKTRGQRKKLFKTFGDKKRLSKWEREYSKERFETSLEEDRESYYQHMGKRGPPPVPLEVELAENDDDNLSTISEQSYATTDDGRDTPASTDNKGSTPSQENINAPSDLVNRLKTEQSALQFDAHAPPVQRLKSSASVMSFDTLYPKRDSEDEEKRPCKPQPHRSNSTNSVGTFDTLKLD